MNVIQAFEFLSKHKNKTLINNTTNNTRFQFNTALIEELSIINGEWKRVKLYTLSSFIQTFRNNIFIEYNG